MSACIVKFPSFPCVLLTVFTGFAALGLLQAQPALAAGMSPYAVCGTLCMAQNQAMFGSFAGMPMIPMGYGFNSYYQTGQWSAQMIYERNRQMALSDMINGWNGAQPMGYSYLPAMGVPAIQNFMISGAAI